MCACVRVCVCGGMRRDWELVLLKIQGWYICAIKMWKKKKSSRISPWNWHHPLLLPPPPPTTITTRCWKGLSSCQVAARIKAFVFQDRSKWAVFLCSVAMGNASLFFFFMSNLGFSLWYLPFGKPACCRSTGTASWPRQLLELCRIVFFVFSASSFSCAWMYN